MQLLSVIKSRILLLSLALIFTGSVEASGADIVTSAEYAYIVDLSTDSVLLDKNANEQMHPASMTKLMTAYLVFEKLKNGSLKMEDKLPVSVKAWKTGGSKMFVKEGTEVAISDLIRGVIVQSGNDACIVLAEAISGSEEAFADEMNRKAKELGMHNTNFVNATGWPHDDHVTTAQDLAILASNIIKDFPELYSLYSIKEFSYNNIKQPNRNPLLYRSVGADGMKTGYTETSGYGVVGSALQDGRRLIVVVNGLDSSKARATESERLMRMGFREFRNVDLFKKGEVVEKAEIWMGKSQDIPLVINEDIKYTVARASKAPNVEMSVSYDGPVSAPVKKGDHIANLSIKNGSDERVVPLYAGKDVSQLSGFGQFVFKLRHLVGS